MHLWRDHSCNSFAGMILEDTCYNCYNVPLRSHCNLLTSRFKNIAVRNNASSDILCCCTLTACRFNNTAAQGCYSLQVIMCNIERQALQPTP